MYKHFLFHLHKKCFQTMKYNSETQKRIESNIHHFKDKIITRRYDKQCNTGKDVHDTVYQIYENLRENDLPQGKETRISCFHPKG